MPLQNRDCGIESEQVGAQQRDQDCPVIGGVAQCDDGVGLDGGTSGPDCQEASPAQLQLTPSPQRHWPSDG